MKVLNKNQRESVSGGYDLCDFVGDATKLFFSSVGTVVGTVAGGFPGGVAVPTTVPIS